MNPISPNSVYYCHDPLASNRTSSLQEALCYALYAEIKCRARQDRPHGAYLPSILKSFTTYRKNEVMLALNDLESRGVIEYQVPAETTGGIRVHLVERNPFDY